MKINASVLIVDDESYIRQILSRTLTREGCVVAEAVDGADALEKLKTSNFDFVISDIKMPKMSGLELLAEIKKRYPNTRVLLITGQKDQFKPRDLLRAGADYYIFKPFHNLDITKTIRSLYDKTKQRHQHRQST